MAAAQAIPARADVIAPNLRQGLSLSSPMIQQNIGGDLARALAQAGMAQPLVQTTHQLANLQQMLQGYQGREQEALGWGQLGAQRMQSQQADEGRLVSGLMQAIANLNR